MLLSLKKKRFFSWLVVPKFIRKYLSSRSAGGSDGANSVAETSRPLKSRKKSVVKGFSVKSFFKRQSKSESSSIRQQVKTSAVLTTEERLGKLATEKSGFSDNLKKSSGFFESNGS